MSNKEKVSLQGAPPEPITATCRDPLSGDLLTGGTPEAETAAAAYAAQDVEILKLNSQTPDEGDQP